MLTGCWSDIWGGSSSDDAAASGWFSLMRRVPDESTDFGDDYSDSVALVDGLLGTSDGHGSRQPVHWNDTLSPSWK